MIPTLTINLATIRANYAFLKQTHARQSVAAVVKADAYGLGVANVSKALWEEGCRTYFVATLEEGVELRKVLPDARIGVFNGLFAKQEKIFSRYRLTPVLNDVSQAERYCTKIVDLGPAFLHIDTGMTRLGLSMSDLRRALDRSLIPDPRHLILMSHLACANEHADSKNAEQLARFNEALALLPGVRGSLCNSSGIFLPHSYHFDLARPGCALYGINPTNTENPMQAVARLSAPILQLRTLDRDETVGYSATYEAAKGSRIAICGMGYADGWLRHLSGNGYAYIEGERVSIAGRVSMDMIALDVSSVPEQKITVDSRVEFINEQQTVDDVAPAAGTIGYEIFTRIGNRVQRKYVTNQVIFGAA